MYTTASGLGIPARSPVGSRLGRLQPSCVKKVAPVRDPATTDPTDTGYARRLLEAVKAVFGPPLKWRQSAWAREFALLRKSVGTDRLEAGLAWYEGNVGGDYIPVAQCARSFRAKFANIEAAMRRAGSRSGAGAVPPKAGGQPLEISDDAREVVEQLSTDHWPKNSKSQLPEIVELCLRAARPLVKNFYNAAYEPRNGVPQDRHGDLLHTTVFYTYQNNLACPKYLVRRWLDAVRRRVQGWQEWSGNLRTYLLSVDNKHFNEWFSESIDVTPERWREMVEFAAREGAE